MLSLNGYDLDPSLPVAAILGAVLARAVAAHDGQPPARLVLTHPKAGRRRRSRSCWRPRDVSGSPATA
ncbi:hypothetical protein GS500_26520 [Rhodococcus hoagii]|nr:hypothetical protein [Prescottella equi]